MDQSPGTKEETPKDDMVNPVEHHGTRRQMMVAERQTLQLQKYTTKLAEHKGGVTVYDTLPTLKARAQKMTIKHIM